MTDFLELELSSATSQYTFNSQVNKNFKRLKNYNKMANRNLNGSIALTKLPQSIILEKKGQSGLIRGIFLPIDGNNLTEKDGAVYMDVRVTLRDEIDQYGQNGFISKGVSSEVYKTLKDNADALKSAQPILGNIKDFSAQANTTPVATVSDDDDLPF